VRVIEKVTVGKRGDGSLIRVEGQPNWFSLQAARDLYRDPGPEARQEIPPTEANLTVRRRPPGPSEAKKMRAQTASYRSITARVRALQLPGGATCKVEI
jgi:hypothetical protein